MRSQLSFSILSTILGIAGPAGIRMLGAWGASGEAEVARPACSGVARLAQRPLDIDAAPSW
jgi:hypothetical protein